MPGLFSEEEEKRICERQKAWVAAPKTELHTHLGGSVRMETLVELAVAKGQPRPVIDTQRATLSECFNIFRVVHDAVNTSADIARITREAVCDFAADGVKYLELRTTPRLLADGASASDYLEVVLDSARRAVHEEKLDIAVGVLVSVDRAKSVAEAAENTKLAVQFAPRPAELPFVGVVGVELSGNPHKGCFGDFVPALDYARSTAGLPVSVHMAECVNPRETLQILEWRPGRVGHAVFVDDEARRVMAATRVPVEVCLTSNMISKSIAAPRLHPFACSTTQPRCFCTDDPGVFGTTLSREWAVAETLCGIEPDALRAAARDSLEYSFAPPVVREHLRPCFVV